jgi:sarcosine oxidase subunit gamma
MSEPVFTSALAHRSDIERQTGLSAELAEISDRAMIDLRGRTDDAKFMAAAKSAIGVALPVKPRTSTTKGAVSVLWMSTDQWLITAPRAKGPSLLSKLQNGLQGMFSFACDVSDARAILRVTGEGSREVLMKGTSVNMLADDVSSGWVRRLLFAEVAAACHMTGSEPDSFDIYVFRSYADYVWEWLLHTARAGAEVRLYRPQPAPSV